MTREKIQNLIDVQRIYNRYTLRDDNINWWCGGCGNYPIQNALKRALSLEGIEREEVMFCYDVGCSGNGSDKIEGNTIHGLHGRVLPLAAGIKIANHNLHVVAEAGDGATFSEGIAHLCHAVRNDYPVLFLLHDNQNYALTTGQPSALTPKGCKMNAAPEGLEVEPFHPLEVVLGLNPTVEGDGTGLYLAQVLGELGISVSRLARGLPSGGSLEFANKAVLADAILGRQSLGGGS